MKVFRYAAAWMACFLPLTASGQVLEWTGFVSSVASAGEGVRPALRGGFGRQLSGGDQTHETAASALDLEARLALRWSFHENGSLFAHGLAREGAGAASGRRLGLVEAGLDYAWVLADESRLRLRLGQFFYPGSRENIESLWVSPYNIDFSLLNSWVGEEFRPVGADLGYRLNLASGARLEFAATGFCCNDTAGALLAWRGFARHHRLSVYGEDLPTAPLFSLAADGPAFTRQRAFATEPFGADLDHRLGLAVRSRYQSEVLTAQLSWIDNRGDRRLHGDQYAWDTRWLQLGWSYEGVDRWIFAGEWQHGKVDMGLRPDPIVDFDFDVFYLLAAFSFDAAWQGSLRLDAFDIDERDFSIAENNAEHGWGLSANLAWRPDEHQRWMLEYSWLDSFRPGAPVEGFPASQRARALLLEWRWSF